MVKITTIGNWFMLGRVNNQANVKASTYRKLNRDLEGMVLQLEKSVGHQMMKDQLGAQRRRIDVMLETCGYAEELLLALARADSDHNTFRLRWRFENLKKFLEKYSLLLNKYNVSFLEKIHYAVAFTSCKGLIVDDNLYFNDEGEIEIAVK